MLEHFEEQKRYIDIYNSGSAISDDLYNSIVARKNQLEASPSKYGGFYDESLRKLLSELIGRYQQANAYKIEGQVREINNLKNSASYVVFDKTGGKLPEMPLVVKVSVSCVLIYLVVKMFGGVYGK